MARTRPSHLSAGWHWDTVFSLRTRQGSDATGGRLSSSWRSITGHHPWRAQRSVTCATMEKRRCRHPELTELWQEAAPRCCSRLQNCVPRQHLCVCVFCRTPGSSSFGDMKSREMCGGPGWGGTWDPGRAQCRLGLV